MPRSADRYAYLVVVAAAAVCTLLLAAVLNPWLDEGSTLQSTGSGVVTAFHRAIVFEWQAPLYFVTLAIWRELGPSVFVARLPSVACYLAVLAFVPALVRRYAAGVPVAAVAVAAAAAPFAIEVAVEMRPYALAVALSAVFLVALSDAFLVPVRARTATVICVASAIGILYTHYYAAAVVAGGACTVLIAGDPARRRAAAVAAGCLGVAALPLAAVVRGQLADVRSSVEAMVPSRDFVDVLVSPVRFATGNGGAHPLRVGIILALLLAIALFFAGRRERLRIPSIAVTLAASTIVLLLLIAIAGTQPALPRYASSLFIPALLTPFAFIATSRHATRLAVAWTTIVIAFAFVSDAQAYRPLAKAGDWYRIADYVDRHGPAHAVVAIYPPYDAPAAAAALGSHHRIVAIPAALDPDRVPTEDALNDPAVAAALLRNAAQQKPLWLARSIDCTREAGCQAVDRAERQGFVVLDEREFFRETLVLIAPKPGH